MPTIVVPELSESVSEAKVGRWLKEKGDRVEAGEAIVELETDKVDLEVGAQAAGVLTEILQGEGESVEVGDELGVIEESSDGGEDEPERDAKEERGATSRARRHERDDEKKSKGEDGGGAETSLPETARTSGKKDSAEGAGGNGGQEEDEPRESGDGSDAPAKKAASPSARRLAREHEVELSEVAREGDGGDRIGKGDVERYLRERKGGESESGERGARRARAKEKRRSDASADDRLEERVKMSGRRRTIARRLVEAQRSSAMLSTFNEVDMTRLMALREREGARLREERGVRLGITSFFVRAAVGALRKYPRLNAEVQDDEMVLKRYYDVGIAVGASEGLVVPVIRDADRRSLVEIEERIGELASRAKEGKLVPEDLAGGTFTITNGGVFGSLLSTPILNPPQVGILGLHKIEDRPYVVDGEVVVRPMMYVALSYDHRIVDGLEAVRFLVFVKELVESPERLLLEA